MKFSSLWRKHAVIVLLLAVIALVACFYQTQKVGFHEDEVYTIASAVNPGNGLLTAYEDNLMPEHGTPVWKTSQEVRDFVTLTPENYFNFHSIYRNQELDNHPPLFYILVHFSALLLGGQFSKYTVFLINLPALLASCLVLLSLLRRMGLERFRVPALLLYGLCMGTLSMVLLQRMYMLLTLFVLLYVDSCVEFYRSGFTWNVWRWLRFGLICVLGFLTQYFFAVYAAFLFLVTLGAMLWQKRWWTGLGFALYGTPAESLCYRFARIDQEKYGTIEDVTDKGYYTNSYHVDVREHVDAFSKFHFESQFQKISSGGAISYVEVPNMRHNLEAMEDVVRYIYDNIQYAEFNTKSDYCQVCGYDGEIQINDEGQWECPSCGNKDHNKMNVTRRTCGYLSENFWNVGKTKEIKSRVLHL